MRGGKTLGIPNRDSHFQEAMSESLVTECKNKTDYYFMSQQLGYIDIHQYISGMLLNQCVES